MKNRCKTITCLFGLVLSIILSACSDWTETESLKIIEPDIKGKNPELYAQYLQNLREYKSQHHKIVYAWFDNSKKVPFSKGQYIDNVPDSIDVIVLMYPENLVERELSEMEAIRQEKGIKSFFSLSFDAIKLNYDNKVAEWEENGKNETDKPADFISYLTDSLQHALKLPDQYNYDGIIVGYKGKSTLHMTPEEKEEYTAHEEAYINAVKIWIDAHKEKTIVFEGNPQYLTQQAALSVFRHIIIPTTDVTDKTILTYRATLAHVEGAPTDRLIVTATATSLDPTDGKTGYWSDGSRAIVSTALWASAVYSDFTIAGIGIYAASNDYYNAKCTYEYTRKAIDTLNPSIKSN